MQARKKSPTAIDGKHAPYATPADAKRAVRRLQRFLRSPRGAERPPMHILENARAATSRGVEKGRSR